MKISRINGHDFEKMLKNGLANLALNEDTINKLNVFPVADGDTGTNMALTLSNGLNSAKSSIHSGTYLRRVSQGMLYGARGNSGVILSQIFKGISEKLARCGNVNPRELQVALIAGYQCAYQAISHPVEGTILTVVRQGIEKIKTQMNRHTTIDMLLSSYIASMRATLALTPQLLPVLARSGVVDSGGAGFILIVEGMLKHLYGEDVNCEKDYLQPANVNVDTDQTLFDENSLFEEGYCMEFILQLMNSAKYPKRFNLNIFECDLEMIGNSLVIAQDGKRIKVHIHTFKPGLIIDMCQQYGEFVTFKLENMQIQHNEYLNKRKIERQHKPLGTIAVVNGKGIKEEYKKLGCDIIIDGGDTMNTSSQEFVSAIRELNCDQIIILPNNKNIIFAAKQAIQLAKADNVSIVETANVMEGYYCLAMDNPSDTDVNKRIKNIISGKDNVTIMSFTKASKDYSNNLVSCLKGQEIGLINDEIVYGSNDYLTTIIETMKKVDDVEFAENCLIFMGLGVYQDKQQAVEKAIRENFPDLEITLIDGKQNTYEWLIGII